MSKVESVYHSLPNPPCLSPTHCTPTRGFSGVTDVGARALSDSRLTSLDLSWTGVTDEGAAALMDVATLTHLDVSWTAVTKEGVESLLQSRPSDWPELTVKYGNLKYNDDTPMFDGW